MTEARKMAAMACNALEDKKAVDIKVIDIEQVSSLAARAREMVRRYSASPVKILSRFR